MRRNGVTEAFAQWANDCDNNDFFEYKNKQMKAGAEASNGGMSTIGKRTSVEMYNEDRNII